MNLPFLSSGIQAGPCPAEDFHAAGGSVLAPCSSAVYSLVVIRRRVEVRTTELYYSNFLLDRNLLVEPNAASCEAYLRNVVHAFLTTEAGKCAYENSCRDFNWGDVETEIPDDFFSAYGLTHCGGKLGAREFLCCGTIGILVDQDEYLGCEVFET